MDKFSRNETAELKGYIYVSIIALIILGITIWLTGCSSMSIAKQKKAAMLIGQQIEFIGNGVIEKCNDNTLKADDCNTMADLINFALDAQNAYTRTLIAMQNGTGSQEQVQKALDTLQGDMSALVSNAISLGIKFREERK